MTNRLIGPLAPYLEKYYWDRQAGLDEWEIFWDYKLVVEANGESILAEPAIYETSTRLITYLFLYGMGRGSTRLLKVGSSRRFASVLKSLATSHARQLFQQHFHEVDWTAAPFTIVWQDLRAALQGIKVSDTVTMRSKVLLAVWGGIPALDTRFNTVFKASWGINRRPFLKKTLEMLRQRYVDTWQQEISEAPKEWQHTRNGNRIPDARLIDIAFWYAGE